MSEFVLDSSLEMHDVLLLKRKFEKSNPTFVYLWWLEVLFQKKAVLEVGVNNPTRHEICLKADVSGQTLSGLRDITLSPQARGVYELVYFPAIVGNFKGR